MTEVPDESWSATVERYELLKPYLSKLSWMRNRRIASFLKDGLHLRRDVDCLGFIAYIDGRSDFITNDVEDWEWYAKKDYRVFADIPPGQYVAFFENTQRRRGGYVEHYAISLGNGLFLQKAGARNGLLVSDAAWIMDTYGVTVATPTKYRRR